MKSDVLSEGFYWWGIRH